MKYSILILMLLSHAAFASCEGSQHRAFDFWLGKWQVSSPTSKQPSHNTITKINNGCGLLEEYTTATGYQGKSLNIFDVQTKQWHQTWIDNSGYLLMLSGGIEDNAMVMTGKTINKSGKTILNKITWTPLKNGDVRQHWQTSTNQGKSWQTAFNGLYHKASL
jgi:hypothetical protein